MQAVRAAGSLVRDAFGDPGPVRHKAPDQPVTEADLAADRVLRELLHGTRPDYGWLSEEGGEAGPAGAPRTWLVDPLDGTANFVEGYPECAVSVGLAERGTPVLGVVYNPLTERLWHAVVGGGAYLDGEPIRCAGEVEGLPVLAASHQELARGELERYRSDWRIEPLGSTALKLAAVAGGSAHAYLSTGRKDVWDVAAGLLLVGEAGGGVRQRDGTPLTLAGGRPGGISGIAAFAPVVEVRIFQP